jgi:hypothetical protein
LPSAIPRLFRFHDRLPEALSRFCELGLRSPSMRGKFEAAALSWQAVMPALSDLGAAERRPLGVVCRRDPATGLSSCGRIRQTLGGFAPPDSN